MNDFNSKRANEDAEIYRFDGRFYDLNEENGVLTLQLRRSVIWERFFILGLFFSSLLALSISCHWSLHFYWPEIYRTWQGSLMMGVLTYLPFISASCRVFMLMTKETWKFERYKGNLRFRWNQDMTSPLPEVRRAKAWRRGAMFYLLLELSHGKPLKLGHFGFSRSEQAWRQDAAQIAQFLEIPPVIPA